MHLNYSQKLIGLSLLKTVDLEQAKIAFADAIRSSLGDAKQYLLGLQKNHVLLVWGILEKREDQFMLYESSSPSQPVIVDDAYLEQCVSSKAVSLMRSINVLQERSGKYARINFMKG